MNSQNAYLKGSEGNMLYYPDCGTLEQADISNILL